MSAGEGFGRDVADAGARRNAAEARVGDDRDVLRVGKKIAEIDRYGEKSKWSGSVYATMATSAFLLGKKAEKNFLPLQPGDVPATYADVDDLVKDVDFKPNTPIEVGIRHFVEWYRGFYR